MDYNYFLVFDIGLLIGILLIGILLTIKASYFLEMLLDEAKGLSDVPMYWFACNDEFGFVWSNFLNN